MALEAYLAFDEHDAWKVHIATKLEPTMFGQPFQYVPLKDSLESACETMMRSTKCSPLIATEESEWLFLKITFSAEQVCEAFKEGRVTNAYAKSPHTWRWYGDITLGEVAFTWFQLSIAPIGLQAWADKVLRSWYRFGTSGSCAGCGAEGVPTWVCRPEPGCKDYCAPCWHGFFLEERARWSGREHPVLNNCLPLR